MIPIPCNYAKSLPVMCIDAQPLKDCADPANVCICSVSLNKNRALRYESCYVVIAATSLWMCSETAAGFKYPLPGFFICCYSRGREMPEQLDTPIRDWTVPLRPRLPSSACISVLSQHYKWFDGVRNVSDYQLYSWCEQNLFAVTLDTFFSLFSALLKFWT